MYKFYGTPLREIKSKTTQRTLFRFDTKGEFITDDPEFINRAKGFFDYIEFDATNEHERVRKTFVEPVMTIVNTLEVKKEMTKSDEEIRQRAKDKGIKSWHIKKIETLLEELGE
jgi:hypothetical protein